MRGPNQGLQSNYRHNFDLIVNGAYFKLKCLMEAFEAVIGNTFAKSPRRKKKLQEIRYQTKNYSKNLHIFCIIRLTDCRETWECVISYHAELLELWKWP